MAGDVSDAKGLRPPLAPVEARPDATGWGADEDREGAERLLVVSASVGGGHDGVARELAARWRAQGRSVELVDFLDVLPWGLGWLLRAGYRRQLELAPWSYEGIYRLILRFAWLRRPTTWFLFVLTARRLRRRAATAQVVVSTYPLSSVVLGRLRCRGRLAVPVVTFLTDFSVHPMWVHPGVDLHLCVHEATAALARGFGARRVVACGPVVPSRFRPDPGARADVRRGLGLAPRDRLALVVAGSWGAGDVVGTARALASVDGVSAVVVCGRNTKLQRRLAELPGVVALGWVDDMPGVLNAADVVIHNAGGLTCMESLAVGVPLVTYQPIAGHGRHNAAVMEQAHVAPWPLDPPGLRSVVAAAAGAGRELRDSLFVGDAAALAASSSGRSNVVPRAAARRVRRIAVRAALASVAGGYLLFTGGVAEAARLPLHDRPGAHSVALAVRLNDQELADPAVADALTALGAAALVDGAQAGRATDDIRALVGRGVQLTNAGSGRRYRIPWARAEANTGDAARLIASTTGARCNTMVALRPDGFVLTNARIAHMRVVVPDAWFSASTAGAAKLRSDRLYVIDASRESDAAAVHSLRNQAGLLRAAGIAVVGP